jgi:hypothetical protein
MGHIAAGQVCPLEAAPTFVANDKDFMRRFKPVKGKPLTFTAPGLVQGGAGGATEFIPFFRLHDARYMLYWQQSTPGEYARMKMENAAREAERLALDARTIDQVAPGEQQPESDHFFGRGRGCGRERRAALAPCEPVVQLSAERSGQGSEGLAPGLCAGGCG